jgi:hypothetical protein
MISQIIVILIISLAAAGLAWWMRKETKGGSSCGSSCGCCKGCDELMKKISEKETEVRSHNSE